MGANNSNLSKNLANNEYLAKLVGVEHISPNDPYWNQMLSFSSTLPKTFFEQKEMEEEISAFLKKLTVNNLRSRNLGSLIRVFLMRSSELHASAQCQNDMFTWQSSNALFILLAISKFLVENVSEEVIVQQFCDPTSEYDNSSFLDLLIDEFYRVLIELPFEEVTHSIHHQLLNLLLTLLSMQVFQAAPYDFYNDIYRVFMQGKCSLRSVPLLQQLFNNYINHPSNHHNNQHGAIYNLTSAIGSGLWSVVTLGMGGAKGQEGEELGLDSIGNQSLLLLLVLCNYFHSHPSHHNPYHKAFLTLTDESLMSGEHATALTNHAFVMEPSDAAATTTTTTTTTNHAAVAATTTTANNDTETFQEQHHQNHLQHPQHPQGATKPQTPVKLSFSRLFRRLCRDVKHTHCTLFLYMLMHHNEAVKAFVLSRTDIDLLVLPILQVLYTSHFSKTPFTSSSSSTTLDLHAHHPLMGGQPSTSTSHSSRDLYMSLIILLILTEDSNFSLCMHDIHLKQVAWLSEHRQISDISLGSLVLLVLVRTIQFNMSRDQYLQTNCLGALANMSAHFKNVHPYVAQKLITLFALMLKKYKKVVNKGSNDAVAVAVDLDDAESEHSNGEEDGEQEVLEELIRMMLEVLNSCLSHCLNHNPHLIYTMLYQKDLFLQLSSHPNFHDVVFNIELILNYFSNGLDKKGKSLSVSQVHDFIKQSGLQFKRDRLKKFSDLNFHYVEEERPEEFFIPYAWRLVLQHTRLTFDASKLRLPV